MNQKILLAIIFIVGLTIRIISLGSIPKGINQDEIGQGYTAYSILKTGHDEWGETPSLASFRAHGDYRSTLQTYLMIPSIAVFGLSEFSVRLPSALVGSLAILSIFFLTKLVFSSAPIGLLASLFLAISPLGIQFSRTAVEVNFFLLPFSLGLIFLIKRKFLLSALFLSVSVYSYLPAKLFVHLFLACFLVFQHYSKPKFIQSLEIIKFVCFFMLLVAPIYVDTLTMRGNARALDVTIFNFSKEDVSAISDQQYLSPLRQVSPFIPRVFTNKISFLTDKFIENYFSYFNLSYWFTEGGRETTYSIFPGNGLLPIWFLPGLLVGIVQLFTQKKLRPALYLLGLWFLLGILPAALTKEGYRPNRSGLVIGILEIISALGTYHLICSRYLSNRFVKVVIVASAFLLTINYLQLYFIQSSVLYPTALNYGYRQLVQKVSTYQSGYDRVIVEKGDNNHIFFAFFEKLDPITYQLQSKQWRTDMDKDRLGFIDMLSSYSLADKTYKSINRSTDYQPGTLLILRGKSFVDTDKKFLLDTVYYPDNSLAFAIIGIPKQHE